MPAGRPTNYNPSFCDAVVEMGKDGKSKCQMALALGIGESTFTTWTQQHPEFQAAWQEAKSHAKAWCKFHLQQMVTGESKGNFNALKFMLNINHKVMEETNQPQEVKQEPTKIQIEVLPGKPVDKTE